MADKNKVDRDREQQKPTDRPTEPRKPIQPQGDIDNPAKNPPPPPPGGGGGG